MEPLVIDWAKEEVINAESRSEYSCLFLIILFLSRLYNNFFFARSIALKECYLMVNFEKDSFYSF